MRAPAEQPLRHRKARDRAMVVPLIGFVLLMPPVAAIFDLDGHILGVPVPLVYVFAVWAGLIAAGALLARRLRDTDEAGPLALPAAETADGE